MNVFAVDTSTPLGSLAIVGQAGTAEVSWDRQQSHAEIINTQADKLLQLQNLTWEDIDAFACGIGPGSFTGIRVGLNFIRTLAYAFKKPVISISSLELLALPALQKYEDVFCMQSAFRNLFYVAHYRREGSDIIEILEPKAWTLDEFVNYRTNRTIVVGEAFDKYRNMIEPTVLQGYGRDDGLLDRPKASSFQFLNLSSSDSSDFHQWFETRPLYIRASEAEEKLRKGILKPL